VTGAQIFTSLQEIIAPMLQTLNSKLQALNKWWQTLSPGMQQAIIKTMMIAAAIGPLLIGVAKIGSAIGTIAGGIGNMITIGSKMAAVFSNVGGMGGHHGQGDRISYKSCRHRDSRDPGCDSSRSSPL